MEPAPWRVKTVGRRRPPQGADVLAAFLRLVRDLRAGKVVIPGGIRRIQSFEEAREWAMNRMARPSTPEDQGRIEE
jgi:hypothetical protein